MSMTNLPLQNSRSFIRRQGESPLFAFEVTMQNHGGYSKEYTDLFRISVSPATPEKRLPTPRPPRNISPSCRRPMRLSKS
ncbi:MAG: hypothetical protein ACLR2E_03150 [Lachnospiraceae bacterium]